MDKKPVNRWLVLASAGVCNALVGALYIWSIFNIPLAEEYSWSAQSISLAYSLFLLFECLTNFVAGWLQTRVKISILALIGGCCFAAGWIMAGFVNSIPMLYLTFSLVGGLGSGFLYNLSVSTATKWFPDKRGFANGLCIGCVGLSPLLFAPLGNYFIDAFGVAMSFKLSGLIFLACTVIFARFMQAPPEGWTPEGWHSLREEVIGTNDMTTRQMFRQPVFYVLFLALAMLASAGNIFTSHASGIGQEIADLSAGQAALQVGILAVANFLGRLAFGSVSDKIGRYPTLILAGCISAVTMLLIFPHVHDFFGFMVALCLAGACFGGTMVTFPALCADLFGSKHFGQNYSFLFAGFALSSFLGPFVAATILENTGSYLNVFPVGGAIVCIGISLLILAMMLPRLGCLNAFFAPSTTERN